MFSENSKRFACMVVIASAVMVLSLIKAEDSLPAPLKRCRVDDEACLLTQAQTYFRAFKHGIQERNIPSIEPLQLGSLRINSGGQSDSLQFNLIMENTTLHNFSDTVVFKSLKGFSKDLSKPLKLVWAISSPGLEVRAKYDVNGKVLILPIISKGNVIINLNHVQAKSRVNAEPEKRADGRTYLKITDYKTITKVGNGHFNMSNLFNDNLELRESTLKVLNDEWSSLSVDIQPKINEACDRVFKSTLQKLWDTIPYDEFFENE